MTDSFAFVTTQSGFLLTYFPSQFNSTYTRPEQTISNSTYVTGVSKGSISVVDFFGEWNPSCSYCSNFLDLSLHLTAS